MVTPDSTAQFNTAQKWPTDKQSYINEITVIHAILSNLQLADALADMRPLMRAPTVELVNLLKISLVLLPSNDPHSPCVTVFVEI